MRRIAYFRSAFKPVSASYSTRTRFKEYVGTKSKSAFGGFSFWQAAAFVGFTGASLLGFAMNQESAQAKEEEKPEDIMAQGKSFKHKVGGVVSEVVQPFSPLRQFESHLDGFLWVSGDSGRQLESHCFCHWLNDDLAQCLLYDSDKSNARLIGVEYIISDKLFKSLPPEEQALWSSNAHEIKSGQIVAPRLPRFVENSLLSDELPTYSKKILTWHVDKDYLPRGTPQFAFTFTEDGPKLDPNLLNKRDRRERIDSQKLAQARKDLEDFHPSPNADSWKHGYDPFLKCVQVNHK